MQDDPLPFLRFEVDGKPTNIRDAHPLDLARWVTMNEAEIVDRLMSRRLEPWPPELPLPDLLNVDPDTLEMVARFSWQYRNRFNDAQNTLRRRLLADAAGADALIATGRTRNGREHKPAKPLTGERLRDRRWLARDWVKWARENVADIAKANGGEAPDPSDLVVELARRSNLNCGLLFRYHRGSEKFRAAVKVAGGVWPDRSAKRALLTQYGQKIPGTEALPVGVYLRSPEHFLMEQRPVK